MSDTNLSARADEFKPQAAAKEGAAKLPGTTGFEVYGVQTTLTDGQEPDRNEVFACLVTGDADITGLVAYSIYKQNKHDWLVAFNKHKSREPNEEELGSYIIGESTPRRLATYRHLAEATLEGRGPKVNMGMGAEKYVPRANAGANVSQSSGGGGKILLWILAAVVALAAILAAGKFGIPGLR